MYCVKCGVKLQEGVERCPLCRTPVWNPEPQEESRNYPDTLPQQHREADVPGGIKQYLTVQHNASAVRAVNAGNAAQRHALSAAGCAEQGALRAAAAHAE